MSRTYRIRFEYGVYAFGRFWTWEDEKKVEDVMGRDFTRGWKFLEHMNRKGRDGKAWDKPDKEFKRMKRQAERAKVKDAMAKGQEPPIFRKSDRWDWT